MFEIRSGRLVTVVMPYSDQVRSSVTRSPTVTSRTAINSLKGRHSNKVIKTGNWVFLLFPGFLLPNDRWWDEQRPPPV
jgi:hypothetical protein